MEFGSNKYIYRDCLGWGLGLWLIGYLLGFLFFALVPPALIGWYVMPIGTALTLFVLWKWVRPGTIGRGAILGIVWCIIAIVCDYIFMVMLLDPPDGYYKPDIYIYYVLTLVLPILVAWRLRLHKPVA